MRYLVLSCSASPAAQRGLSPEDVAGMRQIQNVDLAG
jgi:hypothetical protein